MVRALPHVTEETINLQKTRPGDNVQTSPAIEDTRRSENRRFRHNGMSAKIVTAATSIRRDFSSSGRDGHKPFTSSKLAKLLIAMLV